MNPEVESFDLLREVSAQGESEYMLAKTDFPELGQWYEGKVRDVYIDGDLVYFVTTDRYSAFDLPGPMIPHKGELVNKINDFWLDKTENIVPNHALEFPDPNVMVAQRCEVIPVEIVVRGFITGSTATSLWTMYEKGQRDFGDFVLPEGLVKNQQLDEILVTPTTKHEKHDRPLTSSEIVDVGYVEGPTLNYLTELSKELFVYGQNIARSKGLILVDTKYEFGYLPNGDIILIDEVHTPDSSRYWREEYYQDCFDHGVDAGYQDKEYLRLPIAKQCNPYELEKLPPIPIFMIMEMFNRYKRVYERLTEQVFTPEYYQPILNRIRTNLNLDQNGN